MVSKILIVGANFENKGAQSMLFITVDELKKRIPDCEVFLQDVKFLMKISMPFMRYFILSLQRT